jgi:Arc/MetJ-type ribon-helix-helix transcriptional regulator
MTRRGFRSLTIPASLYRDVELFVEESHGRYVTVTEVVREALRNYLKQDE